MAKSRKRPPVPEKDPIGPDPTAWVARLLEVNAGSGFPPEQKYLIDRALKDLHTDLQHSTAYARAG